MARTFGNALHQLQAFVQPHVKHVITQAFEQADEELPGDKSERTVEDKFFVENGPIGWDNHHGMRGWTRLSTGAFWGILIFVTVLISVYEVWLTR